MGSLPGFDATHAKKGNIGIDRYAPTGQLHRLRVWMMQKRQRFVANQPFRVFFSVGTIQESPWR